MDEALAVSSTFENIEGADRRFARAIVSTALRSLGRIDRALETYLDRSLNKIDPPVLALLRIGAAQLWIMGSPAYAVVSATVDAARQWPPASRGGGLVNAILRRADREKTAFEDLSPTTIWPDWLSRRLVSALGKTDAERLAQLQMQDPHIDLTVRQDPAAWAEKLEAEHLPSGSIRLPTGVSIPELDGYADGAWWVQDAGAALAAKLTRAKTGERIADLCAAPGGKTLQLSSTGADVVALDVSEQRMERVQENLERTGLEAQCIVADATNWKPENLFDAILLDAPCSALGTLRRHPEGAWQRHEKGLNQYPEKQTQLLNASYGMLKPGGKLIYCVCTPLPEEGPHIILEALKTGDWSPCPIEETECPGFVHALNEDGSILTTAPDETTPNAVTSDVFFIARLKRN